jgi:hypothetical protein
VEKLFPNNAIFPAIGLIVLSKDLSGVKDWSISDYTQRKRSIKSAESIVLGVLGLEKSFNKTCISSRFSVF